MKKAWIIMTALLLAAAMMPLTACAETASFLSGFEGIWSDARYDRASFLILRDRDMEDRQAEETRLIIRMTWGSSATETDVYQMSGTISGNSLTYSDGMCCRVHPGDDGRPGEWEVIEEHGTGAFTLTEKDTLKWEDSFVTAAGGMELVKEAIPAPTAEESAGRVFRPIGAMESGTAGASLRQALLIRDLFAFCLDHPFCLMASEEYMPVLREACGLLTEEERVSFTMNFDAIYGTILELTRKDAEPGGIFTDAGAEEQMAALREDPSVRYSVRMLLAALAVIANTEAH